LKAKRCPPTIELLDLRVQPLESLPGLLEHAWSAAPGQLLTVCRRPAKGWARELTFARPLVLSSAPLYELIFWVDNERELTLPREVQKDQEELLSGYHRLFSEEGDEVAYLQRLRRHIQEQETGVYLRLLSLAPIDRATRELSYEHRGLEQGAEKLAQALHAHRLGLLAKKDKDRLDLDFFHLLEHHLERERDALFPAWNILESRLTED
jgi:hemerythrin-like domain-containing protein